MGLLGVGLVAGAVSTAFAQSSPYTVGIMVGLTGVAPEYGDVLSKVYIMAIDEINAKGGVNGRPIKYILEDDKCTAEGGVTAYNKLVHVDKVKLIFGPICSGSTLAIAPMLKDDGVMALSSGGADEITGASPYLLRNIPSARVAIETLAPFVYKKYKTVNMLTLEFDWSQSLRTGFSKHYTELGGKIPVDELYGPKVTDFRSEITKVTRGNPPAIMLFSGGEPDSGTIIKQMKELGYGGQIISDDAAVTAGALKIAGDAAQGMIASVSPYVRPDNQKGTAVLEKYKKLHGDTSYEFYMAAAYDVPYLVSDCLTQIKEIDAEKLRACLLDIKEYKGAAGTYHFNKEGDPVGIRNFIIQMDGNNKRILED